MDEGREGGGKGWMVSAGTYSATFTRRPCRRMEHSETNPVRCVLRLTIIIIIIILRETATSRSVFERRGVSVVFLVPGRSGGSPEEEEEEKR